MKHSALFVLVLIILTGACTQSPTGSQEHALIIPGRSDVNPTIEDVDKIDKGMTIEEVAAIMGAPTTVVGGTFHFRIMSGDTRYRIAVSYENGKVKKVQRSSEAMEEELGARALWGIPSNGVRCRIESGNERSQVVLHFQNVSNTPIYLFTHNSSEMFWWHCQVHVNGARIHRQDDEDDMEISPAKAEDFRKLAPQEVYDVSMKTEYWDIPKSGTMFITYQNERLMAKDCDGKAFGTPAWIGVLKSNSVAIEKATTNKADKPSEAHR